MQSIDRIGKHTRSIVVIGILVCVLLLGMALVVGLAHVAQSDVIPAPICYEDMPCWDCATMGNLICGPGHVPDAPTWIDTPWEDIYPAPISDLIYWIVDILYK